MNIFVFPCCRGSYGITRRVIDKNSGSQYAAKFFRYNDPQVKEELMSELDMLALLDHQNIISVVDGYEDKKRLVIIMEMYPSISIPSALLFNIDAAFKPRSTCHGKCVIKFELNFNFSMSLKVKSNDAFGRLICFLLTLNSNIMAQSRFFTTYKPSECQ